MQIQIHVYSSGLRDNTFSRLEGIVSDAFSHYLLKTICF